MSSSDRVIRRHNGGKQNKNNDNNGRTSATSTATTSKNDNSNTSNPCTTTTIYHPLNHHDKTSTMTARALLRTPRSSPSPPPSSTAGDSPLSTSSKDRRTKRKLVEGNKRRQPSPHAAVSPLQRICGGVENAAFVGCGLVLVLLMTLVIHTRLSRDDYDFHTTTPPTGYLRDKSQPQVTTHRQHHHHLLEVDSVVSTAYKWGRRKKETASNPPPKTTEDSPPPFQMLFQHRLSSTTSSSASILHLPDPIGPFESAGGDYMDFGSLHIRLLDEAGDRRLIYRDPYDLQNHFRDINTTPQDDDQDGYYAFDDDVIRSMHGTIAHHDLTDKRCRRTADHRRSYQNCNVFHETPLLESHAEPLGHGAYRQVFGLYRSFGNEEEEIAIKDIKYDRHINNHDFEYTRVDANIAERLTASPNIYDIYGHCGIGILSEWFPHGDMQDSAMDYDNYPEVDEIRNDLAATEEGGDIKVYNTLSPRDKLRAAWHMAKGVADLHGYVNGVIVHQDIQLSQFLLSKDTKRIKLNDFNRAEFMLWDEEGQEYCQYSSGAAHGNWRSPEEYAETNHNEQIDVFSLANNFLGMLTGLDPFWDEEDDTDKVHARLLKGEKAPIDARFKNRSVEEAKLVEIIDWCHEFDPKKRPTIFQVVDFLADAVKQVERGDNNENNK